MTAKRPTVCFVTQVLSRYRVPLHNFIRDGLAAHDIDYQVIYSDPHGDAKLRADSTELEWGCKVKTRWIGKLALQNAWPPIRQADLVIVGQENKLLLSHLTQTRFWLTQRKFAFFGHGKPKANSNPIGAATKRFLATKTHWWFVYGPSGADYLTALGFPANRLTTVMNSTDTRSLTMEINQLSAQDISSLESEIPINSNDLALYLGSLNQEKRLDILLDAALSIKQQNAQFNLIIAGDGPQRALVEKAAMDRDFIHFIGPAYGKTKAALLKSAQILMVPSAVGLVLLDGFAGGCPLVTFSSDSHGPEIDYIENGVNGLILKGPENAHAYARAISNLLQDRNTLGQLQKSACNSASHYTIEAMAANFISGIRQALNS